MSSFMGGDDGGIMEGAMLASLINSNRSRSRADHSNCYDKNSTDKVIAELNEKLRKQALKSDQNAVRGTLYYNMLRDLVKSGRLSQSELEKMNKDQIEALPPEDKRILDSPI